MKSFRIFFFLIIILSTFSCVEKRSTPNKFRNQNEVSKKEYRKDLDIFRKAVKTYYQNSNLTKKPDQVINVLKVKIDTIFYGPSKKVVFLATLGKENKYVKMSNPNVEKGIQYSGECYIGIKNSDSIKIVEQLKYSVTSSENMEDVERKLRTIYLREQEYYTFL